MEDYNFSIRFHSIVCLDVDELFLLQSVERFSCQRVREYLEHRVQAYSNDREFENELTVEKPTKRSLFVCFRIKLLNFYFSESVGFYPSEFFLHKSLQICNLYWL